MPVSSISSSFFSFFSFFSSWGVEAVGCGSTDGDVTPVPLGGLSVKDLVEED